MTFKATSPSRPLSPSPSPAPPPTRAPPSPPHDEPAQAIARAATPQHPRPSSDPLSCWRASLSRLLGGGGEAQVDQAIHYLSSTLLTAFPTLIGGATTPDSVAQLWRRTSACEGCIDGSLAARGALLGWMLPDGQPSVFRRHRRPSDLGCLTLSTLAHHSQTAQSLPCSASAACGLAPEWMGRLVVICRWKYLPSERGGEIEIDGPVVHCLPPPTPLRGMRAFEVDEAWVKLQQKEEDGRSHRLINLRGEITALSEPFGLDEPIFAAELSSATPLPTREGACAASRHDEGEDGEGRCSSSSPPPLYSTMVLFVGERASRWRSVLRVGEVYVCTHLRQDRLDSQLSGPRLILRSSTDKPERGSHKLTQVWSDSVWQGVSPRVDAVTSKADLATSQRARHTIL